MVKSYATRKAVRATAVFAKSKSWIAEHIDAVDVDSDSGRELRDQPVVDALLQVIQHEMSDELAHARSAWAATELELAETHLELAKTRLELAAKRTLPGLQGAQLGLQTVLRASPSRGHGQAEGRRSTPWALAAQHLEPLCPSTE